MDRLMDRAEAEARKLPTGGCCCDEHPHVWYDRSDGDAQWIECYFCSQVRDLA